MKGCLPENMYKQDTIHQFILFLKLFPYRNHLNIKNNTENLS